MKTGYTEQHIKTQIEFFKVYFHRSINIKNVEMQEYIHWYMKGI